MVDSEGVDIDGETTEITEESVGKSTTSVTENRSQSWN